MPRRSPSCTAPAPALGLAIAHVIQINDPELVLIVDIDGMAGTLLRTVTRQAIEANVCRASPPRPRSASTRRRATCGPAARRAAPPQIPDPRRGGLKEAWHPPWRIAVGGIHTECSTYVRSWRQRRIFACCAGRP